jgi:hypothetical protein
VRDDVVDVILTYQVESHQHRGLEHDKEGTGQEACDKVKETIGGSCDSRSRPRKEQKGERGTGVTQYMLGRMTTKA